MKQFGNVLYNLRCIVGEKLMLLVMDILPEPEKRYFCAAMSYYFAKVVP